MPTNTRDVIEQAVRQTGVVSDSLIRDNRRVIDQVAEQLDRDPNVKVKRVLRDTLEQYGLQGYSDRLVDPVAQAVKQARSENRGSRDQSSSSSTQTTNLVAELRRIVERTGFGTRVSDTDLRMITEARIPREACEQLVRRLGGQPGSYRYPIDQICQTIERYGVRPQDAPALGMPPQDTQQQSGPATVSEYADRLRTIAAGMGLPRERVEQALEQAGMTGTATVSPAGQDVVEVAVREIGEQVLKSLKKIIKSLDQVRDQF